MEFSSTANHGKVKELPASRILKASSFTSLAFETYS